LSHCPMCRRAFMLLIQQKPCELVTQILLEIAGRRRGMPEHGDRQTTQWVSIREVRSPMRT